MTDTNIVDRAFEHYQLVSTLCEAGAFPGMYFSSFGKNLESFEAWLSENPDNIKVITQVEDYLRKRWLQDNPEGAEALSRLEQYVRQLKENPDTEKPELPKKSKSIADTPTFRMIFLQNTPKEYHKFLGETVDLAGNLEPYKVESTAAPHIYGETAAKPEPVKPRSEPVRPRQPIKPNPEPPVQRSYAGKIAYALVTAAVGAACWFGRGMLESKPTQVTIQPQQTLEAKVQMTVNGKLFTGNTYASNTSCVVDYAIREDTVFVSVRPITGSEKPKVEPKPESKPKPKKETKKQEPKKQKPKSSKKPDGFPSGWEINK